MEKLKMHSVNLTEENIDRIAELFPNVVTESLDANGRPTRAIDFDALRQELSDHIVEGPQERYQLDWPGKRAAAFAANAPIAKTLRPMREESVDFDTTKNLFIEGDNLDALKLLQESYLGKVKLIYIDPPYNTGNDFVYRDDFAESTAEYLERSRQRSDSGERLVANTEANGRFHSDWLSMMYPRLKLARNLLRPDGAIVASIDDGEVATLRLLMDEIYGAVNYVGTFVWKSRQNVDSRNKSNLSSDHEYVVVYARDASNFTLLGRDIDQSKYSNPDNDPRGPWMSNNILGLADAKRRPNLHYELVDPATGRSFSPPADSGWRYSRDTMASKIGEGRILFPSNEAGRPREKLFMSELQTLRTGVSSVLGAGAGFTLNGTREVRRILGGRFFDFPKPLSLVRDLLAQVVADDPTALVLDFFAGSSTTAHAVMAANTEDGSNRRFVMVQAPERLESTSEAVSAGYSTIADVSRQRVREAGKALAARSELANVDTGFRGLRVESTNMVEVNTSADVLNQGDLLRLIDIVKPDRTDEDLLFQVLLDWGLDLSLPIQRVVPRERERERQRPLAHYVLPRRGRCAHRMLQHGGVH
jgi:adenine-specific DNA-methyltransferase